MLQAGAPASLAGGRALPALRQRFGGAPWPQRHPATPAALSLLDCLAPLAATALALATFPFSAAASELRVTVDGIHSSHGTVLIGLYDSEASFDRAVTSSAKESSFLVDPDRFGAVALRANAALKSAVVFSNLEPGRYAAIASHDENGNGEFDKGFIGVPTEPYGFSNDVQGFLGPPTFDAAAVVIGNGNGSKAIRIKLVYKGKSR
jgi:uncharacterized protein (DUF2141 family)